MNGATKPKDHDGNYDLDSKGTDGMVRNGDGGSGGNGKGEHSSENNCDYDGEVEEPTKEQSTITMSAKNAVALCCAH